MSCICPIPTVRSFHFTWHDNQKRLIFLTPFVSKLKLLTTCVVSRVTCHIRCHKSWHKSCNVKYLASHIFLILIYHAHSPRSAPKVEKKFADNWWGRVYQEISAKINLRPTWPTLPRFYFVTIRKIIGCVRTLKGGRLYQEILREKNSQYYGVAEIIKIFFRGRPRREGMLCTYVTMNIMTRRVAP